MPKTFWNQQPCDFVKVSKIKDFFLFPKNPFPFLLNDAKPVHLPNGHSLLCLEGSSLKIKMQSLWLGESDIDVEIEIKRERDERRNRKKKGCGRKKGQKHENKIIQ